MNSKRMFLLLVIAHGVLLASCASNGVEQAYSGTFEAQEVLVSAQANGSILLWHVHEGGRIRQGDTICEVDSTLLTLQLQEVRSSIEALSAQLPDVAVQTAALEEQIAKMEKERSRTASLLSAGLATQKQLDDLQSQIAISERSLQATRSSLSRAAQGLVAQMGALKAKEAQLAHLIGNCCVLSPTEGQVLQTYSRAGEYSHQGKPLVRIADLSWLTLRVYLPYEALGQLRLGDTVDVRIDSVWGQASRFSGEVSWIADEAEFTPKSVQTRDMRNALVYAVKVRVGNSLGLLKRGMYGEVRLSSQD